MKNKKVRTMLIALGVAVTILVTSFSVYGSSSGTVFLTRGGSSKQVTTDISSGTGAWECEITSVHFTGLPAGLFGSNVIVTRMRTYDYSYASDVLTYRSWNYQQNLSREYFDGQGSKGGLFRLYASMSSSSANSSGYVSCWTQA
ncbi:MAG: hypothetical protein PHP22_06870 [Oscillospiraceae bacterium]|jgi:hypothetical protein|nr:hypothetical protein [Oscillospiraceae bacterium]